MNKKYRSAIFSLGVGLGIFLVLITVLRIGWIPFILLLVFAGLSLQDLRSGKVNILGFTPMVLIPIFYPELIRILLLQVGLLIAIWATIYALRKAGKIPQDKLFFGFGDVLGIPYAFSLAWILAHILGVMFFGSLTALTIAILMVKGNLGFHEKIKFLPVLLPGVLAALILGVLL